MFPVEFSQVMLLNHEYKTVIINIKMLLFKLQYSNENQPTCLLDQDDHAPARPTTSPKTPFKEFFQNPTSVHNYNIH